MQKHTYIVCHGGSKARPTTPKVEKVKAYSPQAAMQKFQGRRMTPAELADRKSG